MKKIIFALTVLGIGFEMSALAASRNYGLAGCGLGSAIFGDNRTVVSQTLALTTNNTSSNQQSAISSGTSNCVTDEDLTKAEQIQFYVEANQLRLLNEAARGQGETITGLAQLLGCSEQALFAKELQANYEKVFAQGNPTPLELSQDIVNVVEHSKALSANCL